MFAIDALAFFLGDLADVFCAVCAGAGTLEVANRAAAGQITVIEHRSVTVP